MAIDIRPRNVKKTGTARAHGNVLIVEDDFDTGQAILFNLLQEGYGARLVPSRDDALKPLQRYLYDFVLLDIYMPGMPPGEFVGLVRTHCPRAKIIVVSAAERAEHEALRLGVADWLGKPFSFDELLAVLSRDDQEPDDAA